MYCYCNTVSIINIIPASWFHDKKDIKKICKSFVKAIFRIKYGTTTLFWFLLYPQSCNSHRSEMNKLFERLIPDTSQLPCPSRSYIGPNGATFKTPRHLLHCPAPCDDPIKIWIGEHFFIADFCRLARFSSYFESLSNWKEGKEREITLKNPFQFSPYHIYDWAFTGSFISYFFSGLMLDGVMWDFYQILCIWSVKQKVKIQYIRL